MILVHNKKSQLFQVSVTKLLEYFLGNIKIPNGFLGKKLQRKSFKSKIKKENFTNEFSTFELI